MLDESTNKSLRLVERGVFMARRWGLYVGKMAGKVPEAKKNHENAVLCHELNEIIRAAHRLVRKYTDVQ